MTEATARRIAVALEPVADRLDQRPVGAAGTYDSVQALRGLHEQVMPFRPSGGCGGGG